MSKLRLLPLVQSSKRLVEILTLRIVLWIVLSCSPVWLCFTRIISTYNRSLRRCHNNNPWPRRWILTSKFGTDASWLLVQRIVSKPRGSRQRSAVRRPRA